MPLTHGGQRRVHGGQRRIHGGVGELALSIKIVHTHFPLLQSDMVADLFKKVRFACQIFVLRIRSVLT